MDRGLSANEPNIVIKDHANRCCKLMVVSVLTNQNTLMQVIEKFSKYRDLEIETTRMWGMRTETVRLLLVHWVLLERQWTRI